MGIINIHYVSDVSLYSFVKIVDPMIEHGNLRIREECVGRLWSESLLLVLFVTLDREY